MLDYILQIRWSDIVGIIGVACVLFGYFSLQVDWLRSDDLRYLTINLVGAVLLIISLLYTFNLASMIIEICWLSISIFGIVKVLLRQTPKDQGP